MKFNCEDPLSGPNCAEWECEFCGSLYVSPTKPVCKNVNCKALTDTPAPTAASDALVTADELNEWWIIPSSIDSKSVRRLIAALRSERAERDADARAIVDFAKHCERRSLIDTHIKAIEAAKERVKR